MIVNESDGTNEKDQKWQDMIDGMKIYTEEQLTAYLKEAGFTEVKVFYKKEKQWISFLAKKGEK